MELCEVLKGHSCMRIMGLIEVVKEGVDKEIICAAIKLV